MVILSLFVYSKITGPLAKGVEQWTNVSRIAYLVRRTLSEVSNEGEYLVVVFLCETR